MSEVASQDTDGKGTSDALERVKPVSAGDFAALGASQRADSGTPSREPTAEGSKPANVSALPLKYSLRGGSGVGALPRPKGYSMTPSRLDCAARPSAPVRGPPIDSLPWMTPADVAAHNTEEDLWVILHGMVLDLTSYAPRHPGGIEHLITHAGTPVSLRIFRPPSTRSPCPLRALPPTPHRTLHRTPVSPPSLPRGGRDRPLRGAASQRPCAQRPPAIPRGTGPRPRALRPSPRPRP